MRLAGIMGAQEFRHRIMAARDAMKQAQRAGGGAERQAADQLADLRAIEGKPGDIAALPRERR